MPYLAVLRQVKIVHYAGKRVLEGKERRASTEIGQMCIFIKGSQLPSHAVLEQPSSRHDPGLPIDPGHYYTA